MSKNLEFECGENLNVGIWVNGGSFVHHSQTLSSTPASQGGGCRETVGKRKQKKIYSSILDFRGS